MLGGLVGAILGLLVWFAITIAISRTVVYFYPGSASDVSFHSDQSCLMFCILILILPFAASLGGSIGVSQAQRIETRWVLQSLSHGIIATFRDDGSLFA